MADSDYENIEGIFILREKNVNEKRQSRDKKMIRKRRSESDLEEISKKKGNLQIISQCFILKLNKIEN